MEGNSAYVGMSNRWLSMC